MNYYYRFYRKYHFPETIGCLDGTYVEIVCPRDDEEAFYDRKGQYSIHAQIVSWILWRNIFCYAYINLVYIIIVYL